MPMLVLVSLDTGAQLLYVLGATDMELCMAESLLFINVSSIFPPPPPAFTVLCDLRFVKMSRHPQKTVKPKRKAACTQASWRQVS